MAGSAEDQRHASSMLATISGHLVSAALAMIAVEGAFVAFVLGSRQVEWYFFVLTGAAAIAFVWSIVQGGKGLNRVAKDGFDGNWSLASGGHFNRQAGWCVLGLVLFFSSTTASGQARQSEEVARLDALETELARRDADDGQIDAQIGELGERLDSLAAAVAEGSQTSADTAH